MACWSRLRNSSPSTLRAASERSERADRRRGLLPGERQLGLHGKISAQARILLPVRMQALSVWVCERRSNWQLGFFEVPTLSLSKGRDPYSRHTLWVEATKWITSDKSFTLTSMRIFST